MSNTTRFLSDDKYDCQGNWIWTADAPSEGQWINLRKTFNLKNVPDCVEAKISLDSRYWMWINGEMAVYEGQLKGGPDKHSWYYDVVDIAPYLKEGKNTIAILACYWGFQSASAVPTKNQGILFDAIFPAGSLEGEATRLVSDSTWKVQKDPAYEMPPFRKNKRPDAVDTQYNAAKAVEGWKDADFDDSQWADATVKTLRQSDPKNNLVERAIPQWKVEEIVKYTADEWKVTEKNDGSVKVYTFYNRTNIQGTPYLKVKSATGGELIHVTSDCTMHDGGEGVTHWYVTKAGEQEWEAYNWMCAYRVDVTAPASVEVIELGWRESSYHTEHSGKVVTDNEMMNKLYQECYDTLLITMRDIYMDCPDRERTQWWGDAVLEMQQAAYAMDQDARFLYKKLLTQVVGWAEGRGGSIPTTPTMPSYYELHAQSVAGAHSLWQYYEYYGETDILETCYQPFLDFLKLWDISDTGYLTHRAGTSDWIDWSVGIDAGVSDHTWYYIAALNMKKVAEVLGKPQEDIDYLNNRLTLIKENFDKMFWNEEKGGYYSNVMLGIADDRAQAMAVYAGLAEPCRYPQLLEIIKNTENASPYLEKYVLEALYMMGYTDAAIERTLKRYDEMLNDGHPTLCEDFDVEKLSGNKGTGTRNHAWSGGPLSLMYMYIAGITSTGAGFKSFRVRPQLGSMNNVSGKTETMYGFITVETTKNTMSVTVPADTTAEICVPRFEGGATTVSLGGAVVYDNGKPVANLPEGVSFAGEEAGYVCFTAAAGSYDFTMAKDTSTVYVAPAVHKPADNKHLIKIVDATKDPNTTAFLNGMLYAFRVFVNGKEVYLKQYIRDNMLPLPYMVTAMDGETVTVAVKPVDERNYDVYVNGEPTKEMTLTMNSDVTLNITVVEKASVNKLKIDNITASSVLAGTSIWKPEYIYDGTRVSWWNKANGYSSAGFATEIPTQPVVLTLDLGSVQSFNQISLFPRNAFESMIGGARCFAKDFTLSVSCDGESYSTVVDVTDAADPHMHQQTYNLEETQARYVKLTVTRLGEPEVGVSSDSQYRFQLAEIEVAKV